MLNLWAAAWIARREPTMTSYTFDDVPALIVYCKVNLRGWHFMAAARYALMALKAAML